MAIGGVSGTDRQNTSSANAKDTDAAHQEFLEARDKQSGASDAPAQWAAAPAKHKAQPAKSHVSSHVAGAKAGKDSAETAKTDHASATKTFGTTMHQLHKAEDRRALVEGLTRGLTHDELSALASDPKSRSMIDSAANELRHNHSPNYGDKVA